jgi:hypothetical protein
MEPVDNIAQVMQVLRRQMAENLDRLRRSGKLASQSQPLSSAGAQRVQPTTRQAIARRIKAIDADDPRFLEKATLVFVESVLLAEFGDGLVNDPDFRDLVTQVQTAMRSDAETEKDLRRLTNQMRSA